MPDPQNWLRAIRRNVMRSSHHAGIIVHAAVIVGVSMGTGAKAEVDRQIAGMETTCDYFSGNMSRGGVRVVWHATKPD